jgi:hypothetical protein
MKDKKAWILLTIFIAILTMIAGVGLATVHYLNLSDKISQHETIVLGQNKLIPGSQAALRVLT